MLNSTGIKARFLASIGANALRAVIGFFTAIVIARCLNPPAYGDLMFLLGSFAAFRMLLEMGSSNAFFTFLSRRRRGRRFFLFYFAWLLLQFAFTLLLVVLLIPSSAFESVWLGHSRKVVAMAFLATFLQQQVWQMVGQIGEAMRKTVILQLLNLCVALAYLAAVLILSVLEDVSVEKILGLLIGIHAIAIVVGYRFLQAGQMWSFEESASFREIGREYWGYCSPLLVLCLVGFLQDFGDKWMLQRFGGATEQGYFQVANRFSAISLLATTSILSIFWKEIAEALGRNDHNRVAMLYHKVHRGLGMIAAIITGLLLPWSEEIVRTFLGTAYVSAWPVLAIMLLYPIFQALGQIDGTMLLAGAHTVKAMQLSVYFLPLSMLFSYLVLAPTGSNLIPGLGLGALGVAYKTVVMGVVFANVQAWVIARYSGWKFDWAFQAIGIPLMIGLGYLTKMLIGMHWNLASVSKDGLIVPAIIAIGVYALFVSVAIWSLPWLVSMKRVDLKDLMARAR